MEQENMTESVDILHQLLHKFDNVKLYRASDTEGGGWNEYGSGPVRIFIIKESEGNLTDYRGWGQMTFHNCLTKAGGLNVLIVPNFVMLPSDKEPDRLTFKALSETIGNNGKKNMYSMKLASSEDAARLWYIVFVLQLAAKQAKAGNPITIPSPLSIEATVARAFIGMEQEAVDRHLILSRLVQLAIGNRALFSSRNHRWSEKLFASPFPFGAQDFHHEAEDERPVEACVVDSGTRDVAVSAQVTRDERNDPDDDHNDDDDDTSSLGSYSDFAESQDWFASFSSHK